VECAWFANLLAARPFGLQIDAVRFPSVDAWLRAMRAHPVFANDAKRTAAFLKASMKSPSVERKRIFWCGDRIEWVMARGFHRWFLAEIEAGRTAFAD
jgi:hypothetical protein